MFKQAAKSIIEKSQQLSELDMKGDADCGVNIANGFEKILEKLSALHDPDIGTTLSTAGQVFVFDIGSTIGGLLGRAFQKAGKQLEGRRQLDASEFVSILEIMLQTIEEVGGAKVGDKTILDALQPAVIAAQNSLKSNTNDLQRVLHDAATAAKDGAEHTADMVAKIGRASYLGERSRGTIDPGAMFIYIFLNEIAQALHD